MFQHTAARRRLLHLRLCVQSSILCFNTQPPEGGCERIGEQKQDGVSFNTQPPEGGCQKMQICP